MIGNLLAAVRNRAFLSKLILYTLAVSLLPILLISLFFYHNAKLSLKSELHRANSSYLSQTANAMEMVITQTNNSIGQFLVDSAITDFELFPRGRYYEHHNGQFTDRELPFLGNYLNMKKKVLTNLDNLQYANEFVYSVYYIDTVKGIVLEAAGSYYRLPEALPFEEARRLLPPNAEFYPYVMELRSVQGRDGELSDILPVIYKTSASNNFIVVNLDAGKLYDKMVMDSSLDKAQTFFVLSRQGNIILHAGHSSAIEKITQNLKGLALTAASGEPVEIVNEVDNLLMTYKVSPLLGFTFVNAVDLNELYKGINDLRSVIVTASLLLFVATGLLAVLTTRSLYHPLSRLIHYMKSPDLDRGQRKRRESRFGEMNWIESSWEQAIQEKKTMQERLQESMPAYRDKFLGSLIRKNDYGIEDIQKRMAYLGMDYKGHSFMLLLSFEDRHNHHSDIASKNINNLQVMDRLQQLIDSRGAGFAVEMNENEIAVVIEGSKDDMSGVFAFAEEIKDALQSAGGTDFTIGIGCYCADMNELQRAYAQAQEAVMCRTIGGCEEIIYIEDVRLASRPVFAYPDEQQAALTGHIKNGQLDYVESSFQEWVAAVKRQSGHVPYRFVQGAFLQLLVHLTEIMDSAQLDTNDVLHVQSNYYAVLLQMKEIDDMAEWLGTIASTIAAHIHETFKQKGSRYIEEALRMIEEHNGLELSLTAAAERLKVNPSYLSRVFKEKTGENFSEYITKVRLNRSKSLLLETDLLVKEIGERLGYAQSNYFIRLFREFTGMTPAEFRRRHRDEISEPCD